MRHYKILIGYASWIPIDETELEKALTAFKRGSGAIFSNGAIARIDGIVPDDVKMMGWNEGYKPTSEEQGEIGRDKKCISARRLLAEMKDHIALHEGKPFKEIQNPVIKHTQGLTQIGDILKN